MPKTLVYQGFSGLREEVVRSEDRSSCPSILQALKSIRFIPENLGFRGFFMSICIFQKYSSSTPITHSTTICSGLPRNNHKKSGYKNGYWYQNGYENGYGKGHRDTAPPPPQHKEYSCFGRGSIIRNRAYAKLPSTPEGQS